MDVKQIKEMFRQIASKEPEKYFGVETLKRLGFTRKQCSNCGKHTEVSCGGPLAR